MLLAIHYTLCRAYIIASPMILYFRSVVNADLSCFWLAAQTERRLQYNHWCRVGPNNVTSRAVSLYITGIIWSSLSA